MGPLLFCRVSTFRALPPPFRRESALPHAVSRLVLAFAGLERREKLLKQCLKLSGGKLNLIGILTQLIFRPQLYL